LTEPSLPSLEQTDAPEEDRRAAAELLPLLYADVRRLARHERLRVSAGSTLQTTALVHEAYLKLYRTTKFNDRAHFLRAAALAMRHVLVNHARERLAAKRGGGAPVQSLDAAEDVSIEDRSLVDIHEALGKLAELDPRLARVVECRFFGGYSEEDTAVALGVTDRTVRRDWIKARAWLRRELAAEALGDEEDND
jgi:RNA polymerase sigma factor (TIGR02999 family)